MDVLSPFISVLCLYTRCSQHYSQRGGRCLPAVYKLGVSRKVSAAMRPLGTCGGVLHSRRVSRRGCAGGSGLAAAVARRRRRGTGSGRLSPIGRDVAGALS